MSTRYRCISMVTLTLAGITALSLPSPAADIGTAFTYQGYLERPAGVPVDDVCDFRFLLWDAEVGGMQKGNSPQDKPDVEVVRGVFTVPDLDFGPVAIDGTARWIEIQVCCSSPCAPALLTPFAGRTNVTPAPHALVLPNVFPDTVTGNVGIGTLTPSQKLSVAGVIESQSGGYRFPDASVQMTAAFGDITGVAANEGLTGGGLSGDVSVGIANGGVTLTKLAANSVDSSKIVDLSVSTADIGNAQVTLAKLAGNSVDSSKIVNNSIVAADLQSDTASLNKVSGGWMSAATEGTNNRISIDPGPSTNRGALRVEAMDAQVMLTMNSNCPTGSANPPALAAVLAYNNCSPLFSSNFGGFTIQRRVNDNAATFQQTWLSIDGANGWTWVVPQEGAGQTTVPFRVGHNTSNGNGAHVTTGGMWTNGSDRNSKQNFEEIDRQAILRKLAELPVTRWQYKGEPTQVRHIGPMAQDFYAAFGVGEDDRFIGTIDADGVALAAIQGLHELVQEKERRIEEIEAKLASLEALVRTLAETPDRRVR